jgi:REP element-mobilizing transposase RayT
MSEADMSRVTNVEDPTAAPGAAGTGGYRRRMARAPRIQAADVIYHVGSRGVEKRPIFGVLAGDRKWFLALLDRVVRKYGWLCDAYCLMGNHFHLVLETPKENLSAGMQYLKAEYAQWFNACHPSREGALFERRFWAELALEESYAFELARYVALNPVRVRWAQSPEEWPWSSYAATVGLAPRPEFLNAERVLDLFGGGPRSRLRFAEFVGVGIGDPARAAMAIRAMAGV